MRFAKTTRTHLRVLGPAPSLPGFMVTGDRWKLMLASQPGSRALYDLQTDPEELNNVIGEKPDRERHRAEDERMESLQRT